MNEEEEEEEEAVDKNDKNIYKIELLKDVPLDDEEKFKKIIDLKTNKRSKTLFIIPIKFCGFVSDAQKIIAKKVMKKHPNVSKIIMATNAIESSITIDQLSVVIDTGIFNQPHFDILKGLTTLSEEPISIQSRTQRKGRVGRVCPGTCIQFNIKGHPFTEFLPPEIETTDITLNILSLRGIGIKLEEIQNLPNPIDPNKLNSFMNNLYNIGAIDRNTNELTEYGQKITKFKSFTPFLASSIMKVGCMIILISDAKDIVDNPLSSYLQNNFDEDSDIVTILKTLLQLAKEPYFGLNRKIIFRIFNEIDDIAENLNIKSSDNNSLYSNLQEISNKINLIEFIQKIIDQIESANHDWVQCRKCNFFSIENAYRSPNLIYKGDKSLAFNEEKESEILVNLRPGSRGISSPGAVYVFSISHDESNGLNFGAIIHRNFKEDPITQDDSYQILKPRTILTDISLYMQEEFSSALLKAYLANIDGFQTFDTKIKTRKSNKKVNFILSVYNGQSIFTYAPLNKESDDVFKKGLKVISKLMPYTPSVVLIRNTQVECAVSISMNNSKIHFFTDEDCYPYQLNKETIDYLFEHITDLTNEDDNLCISITGERFSVDSPKNYHPTVSPECNFVFSDEKVFFSHMVILSNKEISGQKSISWTNNTSTSEMCSKDIILKIANEISPDSFRVKEIDSRVFFLSRSNNTRPAHYRYSKRPINLMFDRLYQRCIENDKLIKDINLKSFEYEGIKLPTKFLMYRLLRLKNFKNFQEYTMHCKNDLWDQLKAIEQKQKAIFNLPNFASLPHDQKEAIKSEQKQLRQSHDLIKQQISMHHSPDF